MELEKVPRAAVAGETAWEYFESEVKDQPAGKRINSIRVERKWVLY